MSSRAAKEEQKSKQKSRAQWLYLYVEEDHKIEPWVKDEARQLGGDYREEGIYEGKKYFLRKDSNKPPLCLFWSTYAGFDGGWYVGSTLGGSSMAWAMYDEEMPPQKGWVMRGRVPGFHVDTSIKIKMESIIMHEVHICEHCVMSPCRLMSNLGNCLAGACVATMHGTTDEIPQLENRPRCTSCMQGMLNEMSCAVPISYAFEHSVDAWYRAFFIDGFCHQMSYQTNITGAEKSAHYARLRTMYGGYTSRVAQEMACHEPLAQAISEWMHISGTKTKENIRWARAHPHAAAAIEETGCHVPFNASLEHLISHTHKVSNERIARNQEKGTCWASLENGCLTGLLTCLFCSGPSKKSKPGTVSVSRSLESGSVSSTGGPAIQARGIHIQSTTEEPLGVFGMAALKAGSVTEEDVSAAKSANAAKQAEMNKMVKAIEDAQKESAALEKEISELKQGEVGRELKLSEVEASYAKRFQELDMGNKQRAAENAALQAELMELKKKAADYEAREMNEQNQKSMLLASQYDTQTKKIEELEAEIQKERDYNSRQMGAVAELESVHKGKLQEMELANQQHAQHKQQLEQELAMHTQQESMQEMRIKEVEARYAQQMKEIESKYGQEIQGLTLDASQADSHHKSLKQQFEITAAQHEQEKARLRQQFEADLMQAEQNRAAVEAECRNLASQLDATSAQDMGQLREMEADFEARRQGMEVEHAKQVQQLQMAVAAGNQRSVALEEKIAILQQAAEAEDMALAKQQSDNQLRTQELEQARVEIQDLQSLQAKQEEQMQTMTMAHEQRRAQLEAELAALSQQLSAQGQGSDEYARVAMELQELRTVMETERQNCAAQVAELESALVQATEDANVLRSQLDMANAGKMEVQERSLSQPTSPESPGAVGMAIVTEKFVADSMDGSAISLEHGMEVEVLAVKGAWITVRCLATGKTGDVPAICLNMEGGTREVTESSIAYPVVVQSEPHLASTTTAVAGYDLPQTAPLKGQTVITNRIPSSTKARVVGTTKTAYDTVTSARPLTRVSAAQASGATTKYVGSPPSDRRWR
mmetsp:Transcript_18747/g.33618  ORF Transcript_18747/g.33618 Transcript_18747/m.33618 type:complete len:1053 (-) Transcript_18747:207-3365(-)